MYAGLSILVFVGGAELIMAGEGLALVGGVLTLFVSILLFAAPLRKRSVSCLSKMKITLL
jgi:hypothetical protein